MVTEFGQRLEQVRDCKRVTKRGLGTDKTEQTLCRLMGVARSSMGLMQSSPEKDPFHSLDLGLRLERHVVVASSAL